MSKEDIKILLVDDEKQFVDTLAERLAMRGFSARVAYDGPQALKAVEEPTDVIVLDLRMPGMDGFEVLRSVKKSNPQEVIASWLFVKFLTTTVEFQAEFSMASGYVPVLKSVADNPVYADFLAKADGGKYVSALSAKICLQQADAYYTSPAFNGSSEARDQVKNLLCACLTSAGDADEVIDDAFEKAIEECEYAIW